jgi:hypothetical protein
MRVRDVDEFHLRDHLRALSVQATTFDYFLRESYCFRCIDRMNS